MMAFLGIICYHTSYAAPWIFPPLAFYAFDLVMRLFRFRLKQGTVTAIDNQMTMVSSLHLGEIIVDDRPGSRFRFVYTMYTQVGPQDHTSGFVSFSVDGLPNFIR